MELKRIGYTALEMRSGLFTAKELRAADFEVSEMLTVGYPVSELRLVGCALSVPLRGCNALLDPHVISRHDIHDNPHPSCAAAIVLACMQLHHRRAEGCWMHSH